MNKPQQPDTWEVNNYEAGEEDGFEYEDELTIPPTTGMFRSSKVDGVRLYPYILDYTYGECKKRYIDFID